MSLPHLHFTSLTPRELCGDIVESYRLAAERLGYPTSYADRTFHPGVINVLFFFWDVPWETIAPYHPDCIVVNFEPMVPGTHAWRDNYLGVLKQCYLWEYSQSNFQRNRELGFRVADYVPLAYEEDAAPVLPMDQVLPDDAQDIDVVFFGTMTQRRVDVIDALLKRGVRMAFTNGGQGWSIEERDGYLRRAKVVLNFHNWDNSRVVEIGRLSILFRQRKAVVCELYPDSELEPLLRGAVAGAPYDALVDTVITLLADAPRRAALEQAGLPLMRSLSQAVHVGPALERFLQWRRQQDPLPDAALRVAVCAHIDSWTAAWARTLGSLANGTLRPEWVITIAAGAEAQVRKGLQAIGVAPDQLLALPVGLDPATGRNWGMLATQADAMLFCEEGEQSTPDRLLRLSAFLASQPGLDIVSHWQLAADSAADGSPLRTAELDHEIKAELLGPQPLPLSHCLVRRRFVLERGLRHDPELGRHADLHFVCKCAAADARFGTLAEALFRPAPGAPLPVDDPVELGRLKARARQPWVQATFPHLTQHEIALLGELHAHLWAPDVDFATRLLRAVAKACEQAPEVHGTERETLARVLRRDAARLLTVFHHARLIDQAWMDARFEEKDIARFLAPIRPELPLRPSPKRYL